MVSVPLNIQVCPTLLNTSESNCMQFFRWSLNCTEALILLNLCWKCPTWHIWGLGLYFSQPDQSEVHRFVVINWYILGIPSCCHFKMMNCQTLTEILISPEVHDFASCTIIPHPFSSSLSSPNIIFWSLFKLLFPVLCRCCFHSSSSDWHKPSTPLHHMPYTVLHNHYIEVDLCFI